MRSIQDTELARVNTKGGASQSISVLLQSTPLDQLRYRHGDAGGARVTAPTCSSSDIPLSFSLLSLHIHQRFQFLGKRRIKKQKILQSKILQAMPCLEQAWWQWEALYGRNVIQTSKIFQSLKYLAFSLCLSDFIWKGHLFTDLLTIFFKTTYWVPYFNQI